MQIVLRTVIVCNFRGTGRIVIEPNVWMGPELCHLCAYRANAHYRRRVGDCRFLSSVGTRDSPQFMFVGGSPAKAIAQVTVPMTIDTPYEDFRNGLMPL